MSNAFAVDDSQYFVAGGTLGGNAPSYVERQADRELLEALRRNEFCYVLTSRQMGKSSLMVRVAQQLRDEGWHAARTDLTTLGSHLTPEQWYYGLLSLVAGEVGLAAAAVREYWLSHELSSPVQRWLEGLRELVLPHCACGLVVFVDEIDFVRALPFSTHEFFAAVRECHNARALHPDRGHLTFCLMGVASPADLINDPVATPFNVGQRIVLDDFLPEDTEPLVLGLRLGERSEPIRSPELARKLIRRVLYWTGGHPYLTQRLCQAVARAQGVRGVREVDQICAGLFLEPGATERDDNLRFVRDQLLGGGASGKALALYRRLLQGVAVEEENTPHERDPAEESLHLAGIAVIRGGRLQVRNRIYAHVFNPQWLEHSAPQGAVAGTRSPLRTGFRKALPSTAGIAAVVLLGSTLFGGRLVSEGHRAEAGERQAALLTYAGQIREAAEALGTEEFHRAAQVLQRTPVRLREWTWRYLWMRASGAALVLPQGVEVPPAVIRFGPDNEEFVSAGVSGHMKKWIGKQSSEAWLEPLRINQPWGFTSADLSRYGARLALVLVPADPTGNTPWVLSIRDRPTSRKWQVFGTRSKVDALAIDPSGQQVTVATHDKSNRFRLESFRWKPAGWARTSLPSPSRIQTLAYSQDGQQLAAGGEGGVILLVTQNRKRAIPVPIPSITALEFAPDGGTLAVGGQALPGRSGEVGLLSLGGKWFRRAPAAVGTITDLSFDQATAHLAVATDAGTVTVWDCRTWKKAAFARYGGTSPQGQTIAELAPDGRSLVVGDRTGRLEKWTLAERFPMEVQHGEMPDLAAVERSLRAVGRTIARDGATLSQSPKGDITFRPAGTGQVLPPLHSGALGEVVISPGGAGAAVSAGEAVMVYEPTAGGWRSLPSTGNVTTMAYSPDGLTLATVEVGGNVAFWDTRTWERLARLPGLNLEPQEFVSSLEFDRSSEKLVGRTSLGKVVTWNVRTQEGAP